MLLIAGTLQEGDGNELFGVLRVNETKWGSVANASYASITNETDGITTDEGTAATTAMQSTTIKDAIETLKENLLRQFVRKYLTPSRNQLFIVSFACLLLGFISFTGYVMACSML
ncbi:unnamed protein product [Gongylonema pulchrum]|uniref:PGG domain-containing protein n=1 Tax=Gongylonema pulchrum TaxID=637853 RepID=A0A183EWP5_9BILA|nr:unnamed protein product [Gongylonema pulchrum]